MVGNHFTEGKRPIGRDEHIVTFPSEIWSERISKYTHIGHQSEIFESSLCSFLRRHETFDDTRIRASISGREKSE